ncbi:hypothetical protein BDV09DRAFT_91825 [Aspergillus tetrazonus]
MIRLCLRFYVPPYLPRVRRSDWPINFQYLPVRTYRVYPIFHYYYSLLAPSTNLSTVCFEMDDVRNPAPTPANSVGETNYIFRDGPVRENVRIRHESGRPIRQISICPSLPLHNLTRRPPRPVCSCSETPQDIRQLQRKKRANRGLTGVPEMLGRWLDDWVTACWDGVQMELNSWQVTEHCD